MFSDDTGAANAGKIDNQAWNGMLGCSLGGHKVSLGYQQMRGDTGYAYIDGSDPFLVNFVQINDFANADERSGRPVTTTTSPPWASRADLPDPLHLRRQRRIRGRQQRQ